MRRRRWSTYLISWLVFLIPFVAFTAPGWLSPKWLGLTLAVAGFLWVALGNLWMMWMLVARCRRPVCDTAYGF